MDLHYLFVFHVAATHKSFSKTASELHISQPAVSMQIKKLEEDLALKLFDRIGKQVSLTQNGEVLHRYTKQVFTLIENAEAELYGLNEMMCGDLYIGATNTVGSYILPPILAMFRQSYPNVNVNLHIGYSEEIFDKLASNELDIALIGGDSEPASNLRTEILYRDRIVFIVSPMHPFARKTHVTKELLAGEWFVTHKFGSPLYQVMQQFVIENLGVPVNIAMTIDSTDAIKQCVASNLGISIVPYLSAKNEVAAGRLCAIELEEASWDYPYKLYHSPRKYLSPAARRLIQAVKDEFFKLEADELTIQNPAPLKS